MKKKSRVNSGPKPDPPTEAPAPRASRVFNLIIALAKEEIH
ncbi:hypothetical protein P5G61_16510 [Paenibacillus sp. F6_3S_P_1C]|uniref:Uncharacterized protein n=1 Tax=Paenibacillus vandeheii TaxID=3035917 RepID=A0ABT8JCL3_9BACL|nr:hypothetical protein [Paenibacillus vandeheii]